jgi:RNA polymerase sigma factor (sigma-70 family)
MGQELVERIIDEMSSYLASCLGSLGINRYSVDQEDLMQEIRIRVWKAYKSYDNGDIRYLRAYIKRIVYSVFINEINKHNKENRILESSRLCYPRSEDRQDGDDSTSLILARSLNKGLEGLKSGQREAIKLRLEDISISDIARIKNWSLSKTRNNLYRGIKTLKRKLKEEGYDYED